MALKAVEVAWGVGNGLVAISAGYGVALPFEASTLVLLGLGAVMPGNKLS